VRRQRCRTSEAVQLMLAFVRAAASDDAITNIRPEPF
jgi:hypothetical protein